MIRLERHPDCKLLSFQEERALPWITNNGGLSSNVNAAISCQLVVNADLLRKCLRAACETHGSLRTRFEAGAEGVFERRIFPCSQSRFSFTELHSELQLADAALAGQVNEFCNKAFSSSDEDWLRVLLIHTTDRASVVVLSMPHIVSDAVSIRLLISDVWKDYADLAEGTPLAPRRTGPSLQDFAGSQREWGATDGFKRKLETLAEQVVRGMTRIRNAHPEIYAGSTLPNRPSVSVVRALTPELSAKLEGLAKLSRTSLSSVLVSCSALAVAKLFQRREFCFRLPFANRSLPGTSDMLGFLSNDVPMFVSIDEHEELIAFVKAFSKNAFSMTTRFGAIPWSVLSTRLSAMGAMQAGRNPFDDYLINVFPPTNYLRPRDGYHSVNFRLSLAAFTCNELKIWLHVVHGNVIITLKVAVEHETLAVEHYVPAIVGTLERAVENPADKLAIHLG